VLINFDLFDAVLLDLDGTVYHEEHALPGAVALVERLRKENRKFACLTNSTGSPEHISARLKRMGMAIDPDHVYTAARSTADYVRQHFSPLAVSHSNTSGGHSTNSAAKPQDGLPRVFNLSTVSIQEMLDGQVIWVESDEGPCDVVICGVPLNVFATETRQRQAMIHLRKGAALVGICADRVYPSPRGLEFGVGPLTMMLAYAANITPVFCGKPEKLFFNELCDRLGVRPDRCVLIGDNLESDIGGAKGVGMKTILTLTGVASRDDAMKLAESARPDWIIEDLRELV
jgi:4-nitrophenyl phosphatase